MASVGTYLNFPGQTEEAFLFYKSVFGSDFLGGISKYGVQWMLSFATKNPYA